MTLESLSAWDIVQLARTMGMSVEEIRKVQMVFDKLDTNANGSLEFEEFETAVVRLLMDQGKDVPVACVKALCKAHWAKGDKDKSGTIDFQEFLRWWSTNRFKEDLMLTREELMLRDLARKHRITPEALQHIKNCFDAYDTDGSGIIDLREFGHVLYKIMRVPGGVELPQGRIQFLWRELDKDGSGEATFEEFLPWWLGRSESLVPYDGFYRRIRCLQEQQRDPWPYASTGAAPGEAEGATGPAGQES